jgi:glycosyltransferase involved in cell wall biosynthesis
MKVCVAAGGTFHILDLARQLQRLGLLERLYTGAPAWRTTGLPEAKVSRHSWLTGLAQVAYRTPSARFRNFINRTAIKDFDRWMSRGIAECDVLHSLSSFATATQREARRKHGSLLVCERLSTHIAFQNEIMAEEFQRWKLPYVPIDPVIMQRELEEYEQSDVIVVPSTFAARSFAAQGVPTAKMKTAPPGVDLSTFRPALKQDNVFRVLFVGTLGLRKGIPYLLEAMRQLHLPNLEFNLIGPWKPEVRSFLAAAEGTYRYLGVVPRTKLYDYYSQASVLVLPSVEEGLAFVQAQALACGVPVIATPNAGSEDLFTDGVEGFVVPIRHAEAIAEKIRLLHDQPDLQKEMSQAALQRVKHLGGWDAYGNRIAEIYRDALQERKKSGGTAADPLEVGSGGRRRQAESENLPSQGGSR